MRHFNAHPESRSTRARAPRENREAYGAWHDAWWSSARWKLHLVVETIPILPSADFEVTASYWARFGFEVRGRWDDYLVLRRDGLAIELHFWLD